MTPYSKSIKESSPLYGTDNIVTQNNYIVLPDSVIGVNRILNKSGTGVGGHPWCMFNPFLTGGYGGMGQMGGMNFDLTSYYTMRQYLATLEWNDFPSYLLLLQPSYQASVYSTPTTSTVLVLVTIWYLSVTSKQTLTCSLTFGMICS